MVLEFDQKEELSNCCLHVLFPQYSSSEEVVVVSEILVTPLTCVNSYYQYFGKHKVQFSIIII